MLRMSPAKWVLRKIRPYHEHTPYLQHLPLPAVAIVLTLIFVNLLVWTVGGVVLHYHTSLISTAVLSYTLGLRHALDADHISAIDVMTRRLIAAGQRPVTVGTFFSLGHSTIVIITCLVVASTAAAISDRFGSFGTVGGIIGSTVSAVFLIVLGGMNLYILIRLVRELRFYCNTPSDTAYPLKSATDRFEMEEEPQAHDETAITALADPALPLDGTDSSTTRQSTPSRTSAGGPLLRLLRRVSRLIDRPWKMYPLGVLFGLGFDTSSEIALLGIAALGGTHVHASGASQDKTGSASPPGVQRGLSIWLILLFPVLFTAGMCLLDTLDGAAMMALYTSARLAKDRVAVCYYQVVLTGVTVLVAVVIGTLQVLNMASAVANPQGKFWDGVERVGEHYDVVGGAICGAFVVFGGAAVAIYGPWRRWVDGRREDLAVASRRGAPHESLVEMSQYGCDRRAEQHASGVQQL